MSKRIMANGKIVDQLRNWAKILLENKQPYTKDNCPSGVTILDKNEVWSWETNLVGNSRQQAVSAGQKQSENRSSSIFAITTDSDVLTGSESTQQTVDSNESGTNSCLDETILKTVSNSESNINSTTPGTNSCPGESSSKTSENLNGNDDLTKGQSSGAIFKIPISIEQAHAQLKTQFAVINDELKNKLDTKKGFNLQTVKSKFKAPSGAKARSCYVPLF